MGKLDGVNENEEKYYNEIMRKMNENLLKLSAMLGNLPMRNESRNGTNNANHECVNMFTKQMNDAKQLGTMRIEYDGMRKEMREVRNELERCKKENKYLTLE